MLEFTTLSEYSLLMLISIREFLAKIANSAESGAKKLGSLSQQSELYMKRTDVEIELLQLGVKFKFINLTMKSTN